MKKLLLIAATTLAFSTGAAFADRDKSHDDKGGKNHKAAMKHHHKKHTSDKDKNHEGRGDHDGRDGRGDHDGRDGRGDRR